MSVEVIFPNLRAAGYAPTSPPTARYNCIAWAAGDDDRWWEPDQMGLYYWPPDVPREYSTTAYVRAFESLGYSPCEDAGIERGFQKIALFARRGEPTHAAKQLPNGRWTSKLGKLEDIEHALDGVSGEAYGAPILFMRRRATSGPAVR